jgi:hypothetical protein
LDSLREPPEGSVSFIGNRQIQSSTAHRKTQFFVFFLLLLDCLAVSFFTQPLDSGCEVSVMMMMMMMTMIPVDDKGVSSIHST